MITTTPKDTLPLVFASEAARIIGVSEQTIRTWERNGRLLPQRIGGVRVFKREDVERLSAERRTQVGQ